MSVTAEDATESVWLFTSVVTLLTSMLVDRGVTAESVWLFIVVIAVVTFAGVALVDILASKFVSV